MFLFQALLYVHNTIILGPLDAWTNLVLTIIL